LSLTIVYDPSTVLPHLLHKGIVSWKDICNVLMRLFNSVKASVLLDLYSWNDFSRSLRNLTTESAKTSAEEFNSLISFLRSLYLKFFSDTTTFQQFVSKFVMLEANNETMKGD